MSGTQSHGRTVGEATARADAARTDGLASAVLRTLAYADVFDFPRSADEVHRYLQGVAATPAEVRAALDTATDAGTVESHDGWYTLPGRGDVVALRRERAGTSRRLWPLALRYGRWIASMPNVRMVAVTGALAVDNVAGHVDVDLLVVTAPDRLWTTRAATIAVVRAAGRRGVELCPNYLLSERALRLQDRSLFTAHELMQMVPLHGMDVYRRMRQLNGWADALLPNAHGAARTVPTPRPWRRPRRVAEALLARRAGSAFERWERDRKVRRLSAQVRAGSEVCFTDDVCQGHFQGYGGRVLAAFEQRLAELAEPVP